jgi:hypothetical protein
MWRFAAYGWPGLGPEAVSDRTADDRAGAKIAPGDGTSIEFVGASAVVACGA